MSRQIREIKIWDLITYTVFPVVFATLLWTLVRSSLFKYLSFPHWIFYVMAGIVSYFLLKRFAIGAVLCYKAFAPMDVRRSCRFEPTCSTYMIMAIKKYGLVYGVIKGIRRLLRCKPPNGGVDYP